jgi:DNA polymerase
MIGPEVVVTLGNVATKLLLRTETGITRLRGVPHQWWLGAILIPTFHPAAALRGGDRVTDQMRDDFALARRILDQGLTTPAVTEGVTSDADQSQLELFA